MIDSDEILGELRSGNHDGYFNEIKADTDTYELMVSLYQAYQDLLLESDQARQTDFSLLQKEAFDRLNQIPESGHTFKHVIVDEYQDTNTIQEKLFFKLSEGYKNLCVVGDDDQALYRFRGATVENFVQFPNRCKRYLGQPPRRINLSKNYRSRSDIVDFYRDFIERGDWQVEGSEELFRVEKKVVADREDHHVSVVASAPDHPDDVSREIAKLVKKLIQKGKVDDPNQIAFLFPSVRYRGNMNVQVARMKEALERPEIGLKVYAPRAGRFLEVDESYDVFGVFLKIFGVTRPEEIYGYEFDNFMDWLDQVETVGKTLIRNDDNLKLFVEDKKSELERVKSDWQILTGVCQKNSWDLHGIYRPSRMKRDLYQAPGLSAEAQKILGSYYLDRDVKKRMKVGNPFSLEYVIKRATSVDWNVLDLFYRICGFDHFRKMFDLAEEGVDEGPICNLGLISEYLSRFMDEYVPIITADLLVDDLFQRIFFLSYLFTLFRLGESEYEDSEDPFPKGRIPFLTIHQAKGLEFPVVVVFNPRKDTHRGPSRVEELVHPFVERDLGEPLKRMPEFDKMRMFYVALSRAENLLVLGHLKSQGNYVSQPFRDMLEQEHFSRIRDLDLGTVPDAEIRGNELPDSYSFTADFLSYRKCPRQYMVFREYDFVPSRSQTYFFGRLVHCTLEDLHHELIRQREESHG
jgi:DNA helicase-2/ATP-dependent DNA helicase PcrA